MRQALNQIRIEGILSETNLDYGSFQKDGKATEHIGGSIKVKVNQVINGVEKETEIPVNMFATKLTRKGDVNPAYESIKRVKDEFVSIAAGGLENATRVRITNAKVKMNEYYNQNGGLISYPRIEASFVSKIKKEECNPEATFELECVIADAGFVQDSDGVETDKYNLTVVVPQYGDKVDVMKLFVYSPAVIDSVKNYWNVGDTVRTAGRLNFYFDVKTVVQNNDFGESLTRQQTTSVSELVVTGGTAEPLDGDFAFDNDEIKTKMAERKARLEEKKDKDMSGVKQRQAPAQSSSTQMFDLGF